MGERERTRLPTILLLDDIRSASNVGLIFRLCDCLNIAELWLGGISPYPGVSDRAMARMEKTGVGGSLESVPWRHVPDAFEAVRARRADGWRVIAVEQGVPSISLKECDFGERAIIVLGHERAGIRDSILGIADQVVSLPIYGVTNSLNVATCAAVVLYHADTKLTRPS